MIFPSSFLQELSSRVSLVSIVGQVVKLKRRGNEYWGCCPFHHEKTASFSVSDEKGFYHCFGCGEHGDVFNFVQKAMGMTFPEAVEYLARQAGMEIPRATPEEYEKERRKSGLAEALEAACKFFEEQLQKPAGRPGLYYLQQRGLTAETIKRFRLGYAAPGNALKALLIREGFSEDVLAEAGLVSKQADSDSSYDYFRNRVMFPITDRRGRVIAFGGRVLDSSEPKYLNSPDSPVFSKGDNLYALHLSGDQARKKQEIIVVEGYMDVIAMAQAGINRAVAPLGTALTERQIELLWRYAPEPLCCFDGDGAGQKAAVRAAARVLPLLKPGYSLRFITLPDNLDPDEYIKEHGKTALEDFLQTQYRPLFKQLWQMLLNGRDLSTPERKAGLKKEIGEWLEKISNQDVKHYYRQEFKSALQNLFAPEQKTGNAPAGSYKRSKNKRSKQSLIPERGTEEYNRFWATPVTHPSLIADKNETRLLLAYLLLFPEIGGEFLEELADWNAASAEQNKEISLLIETMTADPDISADRLKEHLLLTEHDKIYDDLSVELEMLHRKKIFPTEAREDIAALLRGMRKKALRLELEKLANKIADAEDEEAERLWKQYQSLLNEEKETG
ncbi:MAG: DNA primase [Alphaproteobacteria bacterium]|nr:DNA primase [Alphaproteobacteria bacterium]